MLQIVDFLHSATPLTEVVLNGWVRSKRDSKDFSFLTLNDGSTLHNIQVIVDESCEGGAERVKASTGASVSIVGNLVESPGKGQKWELHATKFSLLGDSPEDYPLQKKGHSREFLREIAHLRPRTNLFGVVFRMRSRVTFAVHRFFQEKNFFNVHTPLITASDCEGAGELFQVTVPNTKEEFFGKETYLTVSGQLEGETFATALSRIYTFGPTFRAENSNTSRHASEFWMIEPEMAFFPLEQNMSLAEEFLFYIIQDVLENQAEDLQFLNQFVDKGLKERLEEMVKEPFARVTYTESLEILKQSGVSFDYPIEFDAGLQSEHERYLCEEHFKKPTIVHDYPKSIKPFYMKQNDDGVTVAAMDVLVPGIGELIGGSQREEDLAKLSAACDEHGVSKESYSWYLDTRKYGTVPHSGFGVGFERLLMLVTGMTNIRDVIPFPRTPGNCEF